MTLKNKSKEYYRETPLHSEARNKKDESANVLGGRLMLAYEPTGYRTKKI